MQLQSKITITIVIVLSYSFLKFAFPLVIDILKGGLQSLNPRLANKISGYFDIIKRLPDILGIGLFIFVVLIWLNIMT